jgi:hypothetical protein
LTEQQQAELLFLSLRRMSLRKSAIISMPLLSPAARCAFARDVKMPASDAAAEADFDLPPTPRQAGRLSADPPAAMPAMRDAHDAASTITPARPSLLSHVIIRRRCLSLDIIAPISPSP